MSMINNMRFLNGCMVFDAAHIPFTITDDDGNHITSGTKVVLPEEFKKYKADPNYNYKFILRFFDYVPSMKQAIIDEFKDTGIEFTLKRPLDDLEDLYEEDEDELDCGDWDPF